MHELSVVESILDISLRHAERNGARRIVKINLVLGELTGIVDHCVTFYWDMLARDTIAAEADIGFRKVPVEARCTACGREFAPEELDLTCPGCGSGPAELTHGRELQVESREIE